MLSLILPNIQDMDEQIRKAKQTLIDSLPLKGRRMINIGRKIEIIINSEDVPKKGQLIYRDKNNVRLCEKIKKSVKIDLRRNKVLLISPIKKN